MRRKYTLYFLLLCTVIFFTCEKESPTKTENEGGQFQEIDEVLANPFKGFAPWIGNSNPVYEVKLQQATFGWADLEPTKGNYDWSHLERNWGNVRLTGKRVGFRVAAEIPGSGQNDTPQWLIDEGVALRPYEIDNQTGLAPDWDDPKFLAAHHDFIMALGARYDADPRVAWIDIGSYGFWGEWHVWLNESLAGTEATKQAILDDYFEAFPTKAKVIAFDDDFATKYVTDRGGGIRNDCLGTEDSNNWYLTSLNRIDPTLNDRVWKTAIITGEFCGSGYGAHEGTTERFDLNYEFVRQTHWSFVGSAGGAIDPEDEQHRKDLDKLHKTLGYRFVLRSFSMNPSAGAGDTLDVQLGVENVGIAPFYFEWPLVLYIVADDNSIALEQIAADIDIRNWLPGLHVEDTSLVLPSDSATGSYEVKLAIHDPDTGEPGVLFANTGVDEEDRYLLGTLEIK